MIGHNQVGAVADFEPCTGLNSVAFQRIEFPKQRLGIDYDALPDYGDLVRPQDAGGNQLQDEFPVVNHHRMAGVCAPLITCDDVEVL